MNPLRVVGLHKWSHCTEAGSKGYINNYWPEVRGLTARLVTSRSGRTSRPGDPRPNPQGARTDRPYLLLSNQGATTNQHSVGYVPAWHLRIVMWRCQRSRPVEVHGRCDPLPPRGPGTGGPRREQTPVTCAPAMASDHPQSREHATTQRAGPQKDPLTASSGRPSKRG